MRKLLKFCLVLLCCYFIALISNAIFLEHVMISGNSMDPTLENNEFGLADKQFFKLKELDRFDIVVIETENGPIVKRIIGLPNEKVSYKDGVLKINDQVVLEDFIDLETKLETTSNNEISVTLGDDEYYVLGDNRAVSLDSRRLGPIKKEMISSRLFVIYGKCNNVVCDDNDKCDCKRKYYWPIFY